MPVEIQVQQDFGLLFLGHVLEFHVGIDVGLQHHHLVRIIGLLVAEVADQ